MRMTEEEVADHQRRLKMSSKAIAAVAPAKITKPSKYRNKRIERHGLKFDSILEADWFDHLRLLYRAGEVLWFVRQVNFELPGGVRYRCDYLVMYAPKQCEANAAQLVRPEVQDCKGCDTQDSINKRKQVKAVHGVEVRIIKRSDLTVHSI